MTRIRHAVAAALGAAALFASTAHADTAYASQAAERRAAERAELEVEYERRQQEIAESRRQAREQAVSAWESASLLTDRQAQFIDDVFGGAYSQSDEYVAGVGSVPQSMLRVGVEGGRLHMAFANRSLNPVVESVDEENRSFNFRIGGGRLATMQRSANMAVLTGYDGTQYLYFVRRLAGEDREILGMSPDGGTIASREQVPSGSEAGPASALLSAEQVRQIATMMAEAYRDEGVAGMYRAERQCWQDLAAATGDAEVIAAACGIAALTGSTIETGSAEGEGRQPAQEYQGDATIARIEERMADNRFGQASIERMKAETLAPHMQTVATIPLAMPPANPGKPRLKP
ncbi:hypothetical protein [Ectothiorhodospira mobilis]|uniref:hypothetical protein n=1 Tax=Ectothiorhodospira mobilis TaxID=195064 RepID=UPI0019057657|nr:hypothetical protein [Ectothiorhodospira mobilis]MBK1691092.1 hypothetical protein [Ectothiorhodospira mobilis]